MKITRKLKWQPKKVTPKILKARILINVYVIYFVYVVTKNMPGNKKDTHT